MKKKITSNKIIDNKEQSNEKIIEESKISNKDGIQSFKKISYEETITSSSKNNEYNNYEFSKNDYQENEYTDKIKKDLNIKDRLNKQKSKNNDSKNNDQSSEQTDQSSYVKMENGNWFGKKLSNFKEKIANQNGVENLKTYSNKFRSNFNIYKNKVDNSNDNESRDDKSSSKNYSSYSKLPQIPNIFNSAIELLKETYPTEQQSNEIRKNEQKENLYKIKNLDKIIQEQEENTPEWKKQALIPYEMKKSRFEKIQESIKESESVKKISENMKETKLQSKYSEIKEEQNLLKNNLKEELATTQNPVIVNLENKIVGQLNSEKLTDAVEQMRLYDHKFSLEYLDLQIPTLINQFMDIYNNFDEDKLEKLCAEEAKNFIRSLWKINNDQGVKQSSQFILSNFEQHDTKLGKNNEPLFKQQFQIVRPTAKYSLKDGSIVDGSENKLEEDWYCMWITKHDDPDQEEMEHYQQIQKLEILARMERLF